MTAYRAQEQEKGARNSGSRSQVDHQQLIDSLNEDLAGELQAIVMYLEYAAKVTGPYRRELRELFQGEIKDELRHAQLLADKIAVLGGEPTTVPHEVSVAHEPRAMVVQALEAERETIQRYQRRIEEADAAGEIGLRINLEDIVAEETRHRDELEQILAGWHT